MLNLVVGAMIRPTALAVLLLGVLKGIDPFVSFCTAPSLHFERKGPLLELHQELCVCFCPDPQHVVYRKDLYLASQQLLLGFRIHQSVCGDLYPSSFVLHTLQVVRWGVKALE
eukprot:GHUV01050050.1.p1 GENE.GHUV01050050.1~~GHUV01050050.1.p1  ORF type:complete len:113 (-),score=5.93 GHUV01050050.1:235-573(-)